MLTSLGCPFDCTFCTVTMTSASLENTTTPSPAASFGREAPSAALAAGGAPGCGAAKLGFCMTSVREVRDVCAAWDGGPTSRTVSASR